jgi:hypothetical protein
MSCGVIEPLLTILIADNSVTRQFGIGERAVDRQFERMGKRARTHPAFARACHATVERGEHATAEQASGLRNAKDAAVFSQDGARTSSDGRRISHALFGDEKRCLGEGSRS